jgi:hypothetical protein
MIGWMMDDWMMDDGKTLWNNCFALLYQGVSDYPPVSGGEYGLQVYVPLIPLPPHHTHTHTHTHTRPYILLTTTLELSFLNQPLFPLFCFLSWILSFFLSFSFSLLLLPLFVPVSPFFPSYSFQTVTTRSCGQQSATCMCG